MGAVVSIIPEAFEALAAEALKGVDGGISIEREERRATVVSFGLGSEPRVAVSVVWTVNGVRTKVTEVRAAVRERLEMQRLDYRHRAQRWEESAKRRRNPENRALDAACAARFRKSEASIGGLLNAFDTLWPVGWTGDES